MGARVYGVGARVYGAGARVYGVGARVYGSLVIIVSAPVQRIGFWGFSDLVRTFGSGLGDCWDGGLGLGLRLDNSITLQKSVTDRWTDRRYCISISSIAT